MRPLHIQYRRDIVCGHIDCGTRICSEDEISQVFNGDGSPLSLLSFDAMGPHMFEITCPNGHSLTVHFPKDLKVVKTPAISVDPRSPQAVLRT